MGQWHCRGRHLRPRRQPTGNKKRAPRRRRVARQAQPPLPPWRPAEGRMRGIEVDQSHLVQILVARLRQVTLCLHEVVLGLVELGYGSLAVLIFCLCQAESVFKAAQGRPATDIFCASVARIEAGRLYLFVQVLLHVFQLQRLCLPVYAGCPHAVTGLEAVEQRHIEAQAHILAEVVSHLGGKA